jgi:hypothetical protein
MSEIVALLIVCTYFNLEKKQNSLLHTIVLSDGENSSAYPRSLMLMPLYVSSNVRYVEHLQVKALYSLNTDR